MSFRFTPEDFCWIGRSNDECIDIALKCNQLLDEHVKTLPNKCEHDGMSFSTFGPNNQPVYNCGKCGKHLVIEWKEVDTRRIDR